MNGHGHCSEQQRTAGKVGRPWPRGVSGNPGGRPNGLARATREWLARTEVTVGGRQADARSGNCLRMDAFCTATNCIGVHRSAASPCSQHAPRGRGVPKCHNNAGRIPGRRGTSARSSGIASDAWLLALKRGKEEAPVEPARPRLHQRPRQPAADNSNHWSAPDNCCRCGHLIEPGKPWHLDHRDDRSGYLGPHPQPATSAPPPRRRTARETTIR
jgi:hypothetical protein